MASAWLFSFFLFFTGISSFCEQMVWGTCAHWRGPPLQGFFERGGGERRTTVSACERSRGGVNVHRDISGGLGMPARTSSLTLPELSAVPGISGIYRSERPWPSYISTLKLSQVESVKIQRRSASQ